MARCLLVVSAALLVAGCASAHHSPQRPPLSLHALAKDRALAAGKAAERLVHFAPLPAGARPVSEATGNREARYLGYGTNTFTEYASRRAFWRVPGSSPAVLAFLKQHPPAGFTFEAGGSSETYPYQGVSFTGHAPGGHVPNWVLVSVVPQHRVTLIRVDAGVPWTHPRSPREMLPPGVAEIDLRYTSGEQPAAVKPVTVHVTDARKVARIVGWFNVLNVVQPNTTVLGCDVVLGAPASYVFRSASGRELASATVPSTPADSCYSVQFTLGGRPQTPLIDSTPEDRMAFYERVQKLLG